MSPCTLLAVLAAAAPRGLDAIETDHYGHHAVAPASGRSAALPAAGLPDWVALGPFGGDADDVAASPVDGNVVLAGIAPASGSGGALYRSTDAGSSWTIVPALDGVSVFDVEFAPDGTAYIGTAESVWTSGDGGVTWTQLNLSIGLNDVVLEVAVDPSLPTIIWAGVADALGSQPVNVMRSANGGATWVDRTPPLPAPQSCRGIAIDPGDSTHVCACFGGSFGGGQVWISHDGGTTWNNKSAGLPANPMNDVIHDGARILLAGGLLFGSQFVGVYESTDDGETWSALHDAGWPLLVVNDLDVDPNDADVILAASAGAGVYRTTDGGASWSFGVGGTESQSLNSVRFAPGSSSVIYLGASSIGVLASTDAGGVFEPSSAGIGALNVVSIDANPQDPGELAIGFQGLNDGGVQTSTDGGLTWSLASAPLTRYNTVRFAPGGTLYALSDGPSSIAPEGVYRREGDGSWTSLGPDQGLLFETELFALRFSRNDPDLILAGGSDFGVTGFEPTIWLTNDGGVEWAKVYEGPVDNEDVMDLEIVEDGTDTTMLAAFVDFGVNPQTGGVLRSTNGGASWSPSSTGLPAEAQGSALCVSPADINRFYLADRDVGDGNGGVHLSVDAGQSWASTGWVQTLVLDVVCDPNDDQVLYIARFNTPKVLRSEDQGATFALFDAGLEASGNAADLAYAASSPPRLLLATATGTFATELEDVPCPWDCADGDGVVGILDFLALLAEWGEVGTPCDVGGGGVGILDFLALLANWGACP